MDTFQTVHDAARDVVENLAGRMQMTESQVVSLPNERRADLAPVSEATAIVHMIERAVRDPAVDIDKMERLLAMHDRVLARQAKTAFDAALAQMQQELPVIDRRGRIEIRQKDAAGGRTGALQQSTSYALWEDINEAIKSVLTKHGFALSFRVGLAGDGRITVTGILSHREGHREETMITLPHDSTGSKNAVQAVGSSTSYGKRYTASALLNLTSRGEDDDAKAAGAGAKVSEAQLQELNALADTVDADKAKFCKYMKIESLADLPMDQFQRAVDALNAKGSVGEKKKEKAEVS